MKIRSKMIKKDDRTFTIQQGDRLVFIELKLWFHGEISRSDIMERFGVRIATASRDISKYKILAPNNWEFDQKRKNYKFKNTFRPYFNISVDRVFNWLAYGYGDSYPVKQKHYIPCEVAGPIERVSLNILSSLTRAIYSKRLVKIRYDFFFNHEVVEKELIIAPLAIAYNGLEWILRYCSENYFSSFKITSLKHASLLDEFAKDGEELINDAEWNRIVSFEIIPHPDNVEEYEDFDIPKDPKEIHVEARGALAGRLLFWWGVDCSDKHKLKDPNFRYWLEHIGRFDNYITLHQAPGFNIK